MTVPPGSSPARALRHGLLAAGLVLGLACSGMLGPCGEPAEPTRAPQPPPAAENPHVNLFQDARYGYALEVPTDWRVEDHTGGDAFIRADMVMEEQTGFQIRVLKTGGRDLLSFVNRYVGDFLADMEEHHGGTITVLDRRCGTQGQAQGCRVRIRQDRGTGGDWLLLEYVWVRGDRAVVFQGGTPYARYPQRQPILDAVADTFRFTEDR